ncbi:hypothetical protein ES703_17719 [subsurface metagenome]
MADVIHEVTYYFNVSMDPAGKTPWTDKGNMFDGSIATFGYTASTGAQQSGLDNNCPGTDLGTITKVELRVYGYGDVDDRIDLTPHRGYSFGVPINLGDVHPTTPGTVAGWGIYVDITNDPNMPSPWTWPLVTALNAIIQFTKVGKGNTMHCAKVEIRVTYTAPWEPPVADIDVGGEPVDRDHYLTSGWTDIDKTNPANASGTLHSIKVRAYTNVTGLIVGTFYRTNGNILKCRDSALIGDVEAGAERTFTGFSIAVEAGDYMGSHHTFGTIRADDVDGDGEWSIEGEYIDPGDEATYQFQAGCVVSIYGYGDFTPVEETAYDTMVGLPTSWLWRKCDYDGAEKCPVGAEISWAWQAPTSGGGSKTPQGGPTSFSWGNE